VSRFLKKSSRLSSVDSAKRISAFMAGGLGQVRARLLAGSVWEWKQFEFARSPNGTNRQREASGLDR
jgi:hypothetical protein